MLMQRIASLAALVVTAAALHAQPQSPAAAATTPLTENRVGTTGELREPSPPLLEQAASRPRSDVDARHCLDFPTNAEVHRCAERYRARKK
jgi:hypothetical protein